MHPPVVSAITASSLWAGTFPTADAPARLAARLAERFDASQVTLTASGTDALTLVLQAVRAQAGDTPIVAVPAYACYAVAASAVAARVRVRFYDIDAETLGPVWASYADAVTGAHAVIIAPQYGLPVDWTQAQDLAAAEGTLLIEDAAQGDGGEWQGRPLGAWGDASVVSFGRGKGWTGGHGGALLLRDRGLALRLPPVLPATASRRPIALAAAQWLFGRPAVYGVPARIPALGLGDTVYRDAPPPRAMSPHACAMALATEAVARAAATRRRDAAQALRQAMADRPGLSWPSPPPGGLGGYLRLPVCRRGGLPSAADREALRTFGVVRAFPLPLSALPAVLPWVVAGPPTPGAQRLADELLTVPTHGLLSPDEVRALSDLLPPSSLRAA